MRVVKVLLDAGAQIDAVTNLGETPLLLACYWGELEVARELLNRGATLSRKDNENKTAFEYAHQNRKQSVVEHLLQHYQESIVAEGSLSLHALLRQAKCRDGSIALPMGKLTVEHTISIFSAVAFPSIQRRYQVPPRHGRHQGTLP